MLCLIKRLALFLVFDLCITQNNFSWQKYSMKLTSVELLIRFTTKMISMNCAINLVFLDKCCHY